MHAVKLTKTRIDQAKYEGKGRSFYALWDTAIPGFGLRIHPSGRKNFILKYRSDGRQRIANVGVYGHITLDEARRMAKVMAAQIVEGRDPAAEKQKQSIKKTMEGLCEDYLERHAKVHKQKSLRDDVRRIEKVFLPLWGHRTVRSITRDEISALHQEIGERAPYEANRTLAQLSKMFELAKTWGYLDENLANPARRIQKFKEKKRDRWVTPEELPKLAMKIDEESNVYVRAALWLYLLTGVRKSELLAAKWEHVDFHRRELYLPDTKAGRDYYVSLNAEAIAILEDVPRLEGNPYILPGKKEGHHLVNISKPWGRVRKEAGIEDVRLHDLRRTVGSWLAQDGNSLPIIQKALNHSTITATMVYARMAEDPVRKALDEHGKKVMTVIRRSKEGNVVRLERAEDG